MLKTHTKSVFPVNRMSSGAHFLFLLLAMLILMLVSQLSFGHGMSEAEKQSIIEGGNLRYMWLGATHMLSGYDHLAFVFGIIFFLTTFRDIAKYVTAFTLGHSITLIFATFNAIQMNYFLIDAVIALSVCYIAFSNIDGFRKYLNINPPNMMLMIIGFGLIHGFGLSTRLQALPLNEESLLLNIISFNVGIELGQISALALMLLVIAAFRKTHAFNTFSLIANYLLIIMGGLLFLMQMHGYEHTSNPDEFVAGEQSVKTDTKGSIEIQQTNWTDSIKIIIPARGDKEYKLLLTKNEKFEYFWKANGEELFFDFHGEPTGGKPGYFESFKKDTNSQASGFLIPSFDGTHGWYWKNKKSFPVTITLKVNGKYKRLDVKETVTPQPDNLIQKETTTHDTID